MDKCLLFHLDKKSNNYFSFFWIKIYLKQIYLENGKLILCSYTKWIYILYIKSILIKMIISDHNKIIKISIY